METLYKMYEHLNWANSRILQRIQIGKDAAREARRLFSHLLFAERVWFMRLKGEDCSSLNIWCELDIEGCEILVKENEEMIRAYFTYLEDGILDKEIVYKNSKGIEYISSIREILTHVALHGHYHRGQINFLLRTNDLEPVEIDFITWTR
ncbi:DinB family protein [Metabacillus fastidiosus]|uniref:DinB family protein n=1 Tax=Metabacillus fastidiosus TaxID=1458 RepID=UPI000825BDC3|nr:DinB family protein [Metabacillus fastidiosus]MED4461560.1 DinB family protein [Metabacillus fastidiosus]